MAVTSIRFQLQHRPQSPSLMALLPRLPILRGRHPILRSRLGNPGHPHSQREHHRVRPDPTLPWVQVLATMLRRRALVQSLRPGGFSAESRADLRRCSSQCLPSSSCAVAVIPEQLSDPARAKLQGVSKLAALRWEKLGWRCVLRRAQRVPGRSPRSVPPAMA